ncbi:MAG: GNAT family protein [Thermodesulfobacteriota bacterium]|nr:GNAT family protein [Thermodesulfobacteriota bacterium]
MGERDNKKALVSHFIDGKRIYLREVRLSDVGESYHRWLNDPDVNRYLETRYIPQSLEGIKRYVERMDGNTSEIFLAICLKENDKHIGNIKLGPINWIHRFADVSLLIGEKAYWGKGIATEAITILTAFAFDILNLHKLRAGCYAENIGSATAFMKAGFREEGILKKQRCVKGQFQDEMLFGLCCEDWVK